MKTLAGSLVLIILLLFSSVSDGGIFKCVGSDGSITFSDTPCSAEQENQTVVRDLDSHVTTYSSEYADGYEDYGSRNTTENRQLQPQQREAPEYIEIPPEPDRPQAPSVEYRTVPGTPHMAPTTRGGFVLRTGERSYFDPQTGQAGEGEFIGDRYDREEEFVDPDESAAYREAMREYREAKFEREIAIEAEKHAAKSQGRNASPQYCGEMQVRLAKAKQEEKSLRRQLENLESSRPSSRASAEQRANHFKRTKASKERVRDQLSENRRQQQEYSGNYRRLCR